MSGKHRMRSNRAARRRAATAAGALAATAGIGLATPGLAQAAGPDYTQVITDSSDALNNSLAAANNITNGLGFLWNPVAGSSGGVLPVFWSNEQQNDLTTVTGILDALSNLQLPTVSGSTIPGLTPEMSSALGPLTDQFGQVTDIIGSVVDPVQQLVGTTNSLVGTLNTLLGPLGIAVPTADDLLSGLLDGLLTATDTQYSSGYDWSLVGLTGQTNINNLFVQVPSLSGSELVSTLANNLLGQLGGNQLVSDQVANILAQTPLADIVTPSLTVWNPSGNGNYTLPFDGAVGWLAAMPVIDLGPVSVLGQEVSSTDTVAAIPLWAYGITAPGGLFNYANLGTTGLVLPTATGVSTIGGTSASNFGIPLAGLNILTLNTAQSTYYGTNGFYYNSGLTAQTITIGGVTIPIVYSLGSVNAGPGGIGFTLPSVAGIGLLPPIQIGEVPGQTSPDGILAPEAINALVAALGLTSQPAITLTGLLGLDGPITSLTDALGSVYTPVAAAVGTPITNALNDNLGPAVEQLTSTAASLSGNLADATANLPQESTTTSAPLALSAAAPDSTGPVTPLSVPETPAPETPAPVAAETPDPATAVPDVTEPITPPADPAPTTEQVPATPTTEPAPTSDPVPEPTTPSDTPALPAEVTPTP